MHITNKFGFPEPLVQAVTPRPRGFGPDHISITELVGPPLIRRLRREHDDEIRQDVIDRIYAVDGQSIHWVLEQAGHYNRLAEERLRIDVLGWIVSGQPDLYDDTEGGTITDWKKTSVWSFLLGTKPEWVAQVNCYAWLLRRATFPVQKGQIIAFLRDWSWGQSQGNNDYPKHPVYKMDVPLWPDNEVGAYVLERVKLHQQAMRMNADAIPLCTPDERWQRPTTYAVKKKGGKRALPGGVHENAEDAIAFQKTKDYPTEIEERPGQPVRCMSRPPLSPYCPGAPWCRFGKQFHQEESAT
jgi:hypothetical protein